MASGRPRARRLSVARDGDMWSKQAVAPFSITASVTSACKGLDPKSVLFVE
jgi:hypothetical protein